MMEAIKCPYCGEENHTSTPSAMAECAYCQWKFAEARSDDRTLVILDRDMPGVEHRAGELEAMWREQGASDREVIIDRRIRRGVGESPRRRHYDKNMILH